MSNVTVREAGREDADALLSLIDALADYEELDRPNAEAKARLVADGFTTNPPRFETLLAFVPERESPVAYAIHFPTYSTFLAKPTLYLEDFFVLPEYRKHGIGNAVFQHLLQLAKERDCGRMEWMCLNWNELGIQFYAKRGATVLDEWRFYRLTEEQIAALTE